VMLTPRSVAALGEAAQLDESNRTNVVNRAIQLYLLVIREMNAKGNEVYIRETGTGKITQLHLL
jgi:hypothetical protein